MHRVMSERGEEFILIVSDANGGSFCRIYLESLNKRDKKQNRERENVHIVKDACNAYSVPEIQSWRMNRKCHRVVKVL